jgi:RNase adapter protein RapZ
MPGRNKKSTQLVLITGMSGSGKSVALHALEDAGFYCVDNLPPELLLPFVRLERKHSAFHLAIAMDVRSASSLPLVPPQLEALRAQGMEVKIIFLDASTPTLVRRYSETRRKHPLSQSDTLHLQQDVHHALEEAIELERTMLAGLREQAHGIDTSLIRPSQLQAFVKSLITAPARQLTLVFESFGFKRGTPTDADYIFDVRMLPNPHYEPELRVLTGRDAAVAEFLRLQPDVQRMQQQIAAFLEQWLDAMVRDHRSYVTVAIGCTGGQHRSVFLVEQLAQHFCQQWVTIKRHRELV